MDFRWRHGTTHQDHGQHLGTVTVLLVAWDCIHSFESALAPVHSQTQMAFAVSLRRQIRSRVVLRFDSTRLDSTRLSSTQLDSARPQTKPHAVAPYNYKQSYRFIHAQKSSLCARSSLSLFRHPLNL